jgi:hypothetical protein
VWHTNQSTGTVAGAFITSETEFHNCHFAFWQLSLGVDPSSLVDDSF